MSGKVFAFVALLMVPALVLADGNMAEDAGPIEVAISGAGTNDRSFRQGDFTLDGQIGVFLLPILEVSARDGVSYSDFGGKPDWDNTVKGALDLELPLDRLEPYIGGNVGYITSTTFRSTTEAAPELGLKLFITRSAFVFAQAEYDFFFTHNSTTFNTGEFNYTVGVGFRF
jgi:hypothetical protein